MNHQNLEPSTARRCAQLKQKIRLSKCQHGLIKTISTKCGHIVECCVDCERLVTISSPPNIHCIHNGDDYVFMSLNGGGWLEYCNACGQVLNTYEP